MWWCVVCGVVCYVCWLKGFYDWLLYRWMEHIRYRGRCLRCCLWVHTLRKIVGPYWQHFLDSDPIGMPAILSYVLWYHRGKLHRPDVLLKLGFLYEGRHTYAYALTHTHALQNWVNPADVLLLLLAYNAELWYFEAADTLNKLFLTSLLIFVPTNYQMVRSMHTCICTCAGVLFHIWIVVNI